MLLALSNKRPRRLLPPDSRQAGFSLIELLVSVVIMAEILVGVAILFDSSNRLARSQTHVAELQQSLRVGQSEVVRFARMAGIGGLPITRLQFLPHPGEPQDPPNYDLVGAFPRESYALAVMNNVAAGTTFSSSSPDTVELLEGSDVLILRGVFTTPLYYLDPPLNLEQLWGDPLAFPLAVDDQPVTISNRVRDAGQYWEDYPQNIDALGARLVDALGSTTGLHKKVALILRDTLNPNHYVVVELDEGSDTGPMGLTPAACGGTSPGFPDETCLRSITFDLHLNLTAGSPGEAYAKLSTGTNLLQGGIDLPLPAAADPPAAPPAPPVQVPTTIGSIGLLEEYRFFIRLENEVPGDAATRLTPVLTRARFLPGTDEMIDRVDIADNVIDLQLAIGADANSKDHPGYGLVLDNGNKEDEVLFNSEDDTKAGNSYQPPDGVDEVATPVAHPPDAGAAVSWYDPQVEFHFLRINTLVQSRVPDTKIQAPALSPIEDHDRGPTITINAGPPLGTRTYNDETEYHRRWLQTVVELRNLL